MLSLHSTDAIRSPAVLMLSLHSTDAIRSPAVLMLPPALLNNLRSTDAIPRHDFHRTKDKKLMFSFFISINRGARKTCEAQNFLPVASWLQELFSTVQAFVLDMRHVYIQYFGLPRLPPLWRSGMSFASHARGLGFVPGRVRLCILVVVFFMWFRLWATSFQNNFDLSFKEYRTIICF